MIKDLKELAKLISLCQKQGVESIKLGDIELKIVLEYKIKTSYHPERFGSIVSAPRATTQITEDVKISVDSLTDEQMLYYSVSDEGAN